MIRVTLGTLWKYYTGNRAPYRVEELFEVAVHAMNKMECIEIVWVMNLDRSIV